MHGIRGVKTWVMGWLAAALAVILITLFAVSRVHAQEVSDSIPGDVSASNSATVSARTTTPQVLQGTFVKIIDSSAGSIFALGSSVRQQAPVSGDLAALAGSVVIDDEVSQDVYVSAGSVVISGHVRGNVAIFAGSVVIDRDAQIDGSLLVMSENVRMAGTVNGDMIVRSQSVEWSGAVRGNTEVHSRSLILTDSAQTANVSGTVGSLQRSEAALVAGTFMVESSDIQNETGSNLPTRLGINALMGAVPPVVLWLVVRRRWPLWHSRFTRSWTTVALTGATLGLFWPLLACFLVLSFVGIPFAIVGTLLWGIFLWYGWVVALQGVVYAVGVRKPNWPMWVVAGGVGAAAGILFLFPLVGWIIRLGLGLLGLGIFSWGSYQAFRLPLRQ